MKTAKQTIDELAVKLTGSTFPISELILEAMENYADQFKSKYSLTENWCEADKDGNINIPDHLDKLINKVGFQLRFHTISDKNEIQTVCDIVRISEEYFLKP
jgi:hypothetical protein